MFIKIKCPKCNHTTTEDVPAAAKQEYFICIKCTAFFEVELEEYVEPKQNTGIWMYTLMDTIVIK